jgi:MshEN domain/PilZ domain
MPDSGANRREHVRLPSDGTSAKGISSGDVQGLPQEARVEDISEGGMRLGFSWQGGKPFPLQSGDTLSFHLKIAGSSQNFEVMTLVRHVAPNPRGSGFWAGVQFSGLDAAVRETLKSMLLNMALTKLRAGKSSSATAAAAGPQAPGEIKRSLTTRKATFDARPAPPPGTAPVPAQESAPAEPPQPPERSTTGRRRRMYLGEILVKQGAVAAEKLQQFLARSPGDKVPIGQKLISHGLVDDITIAKAVAVQVGLSYVDLTNEEPDFQLAQKMPRELFIKNHAIPLRVEWNCLLVAMATKPTPPIMEELELAAGQRVRVCIGAESGLTRWLKRLYNYEAPTRFAKARFPVQLRVEYRFMDKARGEYVHDLVTAGITRELGMHELIIAGPLPGGVDADRVRKESLTMEVQVEGGALANAMVVDCRPLSISESGYAGEYYIACYIDKFPEGGESAWTRLCMHLG